MSLPSLLIGLIVSTLLGSAFHLWKGGGFGRLILDIVLGWLGFWLGQFVGGRLNIRFGDLGALHLFPALVIGVVFLFLGNWLVGAESEREIKRKPY